MKSVWIFGENAGSSELVDPFAKAGDADPDQEDPLLVVLPVSGHVSFANTFQLLCEENLT